MWRPRGHALLIVTLLTLSFLLIGSLGVLTMGTEMQSDGHMPGCPFMGENAICGMSPLEHMAAWQSMFVSTLTKIFKTHQLLLLVAAIFAAFLTMRLLFETALDLLASRQRLYLKYSYAYAYVPPLQEAFSQGILHPKIY